MFFFLKKLEEQYVFWFHLGPSNASFFKFPVVTRRGKRETAMQWLIVPRSRNSPVLQAFGRTCRMWTATIFIPPNWKYTRMTWKGMRFPLLPLLVSSSSSLSSSLTPIYLVWGNKRTREKKLVRSSLRFSVIGIAGVGNSETRRELLWCSVVLTQRWDLTTGSAAA